MHNRNINYTNVCTFKCRFCGFSKGPLSLNLRGTPYLLTLDDIAEPGRARPWDAGATEVCLQGGIHPNFDGDYYIDVTRAIWFGRGRFSDGVFAIGRFGHDFPSQVGPLPLCAARNEPHRDRRQSVCVSLPEGGHGQCRSAALALL